MLINQIWEICPPQKLVGECGIEGIAELAFVVCFLQASFPLVGYDIQFFFGVVFWMSFNVHQPAPKFRRGVVLDADWEDAF